MIAFDFDNPADRHGTGSTKWNRYGGRDVIPLWVADMDFRAPPCVLEALQARVAHGIFGYTDPTQALNDTIVAHLAQTYNWSAERDWLVWLPGLVSALNVTARGLCDAGQQVVTATPVYPPFLSAPLNQGRQVVSVPMLEEDGRWRWDLDGLDAAITPATRLLSLCNPHNPVGRVFDRTELLEIAHRCEQHDLFICSDEIHCGLVLEPGLQHIPIATLSPEIAARTVTLMAASKTFNLPGLGCAFAVIPNAKLRSRIKRANAGIVPRIPTLGFTGTEAAYRNGATWQTALLDYLRGNRELVLDSLRHMPLIKTYPIEATYLAWIDACALPVADPTRFFEEAGVGLSDGAEFGAPGFVRLNFGCPRALLKRALERMANALAPFKT